MSEEMKKKVQEIESTISNKEEAAKVLGLVTELIDMFATKVVEVKEGQIKLEEKVEDVFELLSNIEEEMIENFNNEYEAQCPYCGEIIPFKIPEEEDEEFECPMCGKVIEMELLFGDDDCGCGSCHDCGGCGHDHDEEDED